MSSQAREREREKQELIVQERSRNSAIKGCRYSGDMKKRIYSEEEIEERAMTKKKISTTMSVNPSKGNQPGNHTNLRGNPIHNL